jgi:hypothetical protein
MEEHQFATGLYKYTWSPAAKFTFSSTHSLIHSFTFQSLFYDVSLCLLLFRAIRCLRRGAAICWRLHSWISSPEEWL